MRRTTFVVSSLIVLLGAAPLLAAARFPDVPETHVYYESIEALSAAGVVTGHPDGKFRPEDPVNRAQLLAMLYRAKGKTPDPTSTGCFDDVEEESWYETTVCDAAANKYVQGYAGKVFKPDQKVTRVEALKMIIAVFGIELLPIDQAARDTIKFVDVSTAAWYTQHLYTAFAEHILPIAGQSGARFYPDWPLLRGEAAAYIHNAMKVQLEAERSAVQEASSSDAQVSSEADSDSSQQSQRTTSKSASSAKVITKPIEAKVTFPFEHGGKFSGRQTYSMLFSLDKSQTIIIDTTMQAGQGGIDCILYRIDKGEEFPYEYYLGHVEDINCYLKVSVSPGDYRLQLKPTYPESTFTVTAREPTAEETKGLDHNDGFREAIRLIQGVPPRSGLVLDTGDLQDWYSFSVTTEKSMTLELSNDHELDCFIYPMKDVTLASFEQPSCNHVFSYPKGTYYVSIFRTIGTRNAKKTYSIRLQ